MPQAAVCNMQGDKVGEVQLSAEVFGAELNEDLIHQALVTVAKARQRQAGRTKTRSEIKLTHGKWYRQKGMGRARHGAQSAPLFVGGAKAHGPRGEGSRVAMPRRMRRQALHSALSAQIAAGKVTILDEIRLDEIKTKRVVQMLEDLGVRGNMLLLLGPAEAEDDRIYKSCRNVAGLIPRPAPHFSVREVLWADNIVITRSALALLESGEKQDAES